jgi:hypothetical protein
MVLLGPVDAVGQTGEHPNPFHRPLAEHDGDADVVVVEGVVCPDPFELLFPDKGEKI